MAPKLTLSGVPSAKFNGAKVFIDTNFNFFDAEDELSLGNNSLPQGSEGVITWIYDKKAGLLTLSGEDTVANYQAALRKVTYTYTDSGSKVGRKAKGVRIYELSFGS